MSFDIFGLVVGLALEGKGTEADDLTGFQPDLTQPQIDAFLNDPAANGAALLQNATSRFVYSFARLGLSFLHGDAAHAIRIFESELQL